MDFDRTGLFLTNPFHTLGWTVLGSEGHVKLSLLNYAVYPEFPDRTVEVRTCATSYASRGL